MSENKGDLISREALLARVGTVETNTACAEKNNELPDIVKKIFIACASVVYKIINNAPAVDAVEVVRCKDCKDHCIEETERGEKYIACNRFDEVMRADDFCSYGERKDGADNGKAD